MRIGWATPFNVRSAIGRYSRVVAAELRRRGQEVEIIRIENADAAELPVLETELFVHRPTSLDSAELAEKFDILVLNVGNQPYFHGECVKYFTGASVVSIFHDADVTDLSSGLEYLYDWPVNRLSAELVSLVPGNSATAGETGSQLALFAALSAGAVAHGPHYIQVLSDFCPGPTLGISLCYPDMGSIEPRPDPDDEFLVVTFGVITPNKQPDRVMRALAQSPLLRAHARYQLVGSIEPHEVERLTTLAAELGLRPLEIFGWVSDQQLFELLSKAHAVCCLRYPISEGGSASLISALYSARPLIVADAGAYAQVSDELVVKVSYGLDPSDLCIALETIFADRAGADARAMRAKSWAVPTFSAEAYVDNLLPFLERCLSESPVVNAARMLGGTLGALGAGLHEPAVSRIGDAIQDLFAARPQRSEYQQCPPKPLA